MIDPVEHGDKLYYTPEQACRPLEMGLDEVEHWMATGHLKYTSKKARGKRRIWRDDLYDFARWYREKYLVCPSIPTKSPPSGNTISNVVELDFSDRSTAKKAAPRSGSIGQRRKPNARKRSLDLNAPAPHPSGRG